MSELRKDPVIGRWVIISTERGERPIELEPPRPRRTAFCPFCAGNEDMTPPEILALRSHDSRPNQPGWRVRVVANKFPALRIEGELDRRSLGIYDLMSGIGAHEVVIESPRHDLELSQMPLASVREVLWAFRERMRDLKRDQRFRYLLVFKNHGAAAGASLEHAHAQIIATPIVPKRVQEEVEGAFLHLRETDRCIFCDVIAQERQDRMRVIGENDAVVAFEPFASRFPFETWLLPRHHQSHFEEEPVEILEAIAELLRATLWRLRQALDGAAYNFVLHTAPTHDVALEHYHWHIEIMPKLTNVAGFEWGTGFYINPTPPEDAATALRGIHVDGEG